MEGVILPPVQALMLPERCVLEMILPMRGRLGFPGRKALSVYFSLCLGIQLPLGVRGSLWKALQGNMPQGNMPSVDDVVACGVA